MNIVGKLFSNVRGFYNEINPATLTGAIDVVVVQQSDGSYTTSPWHVRFGKMGVIRASQKVVDIEINGEPADLHMKLGEAGEAFFVEEAEDAAEVPAYLATSPISPSLSQMEAGLVALKAAASAPDMAMVPDDPVTPVVEHNGTVVTMEDGKMVVSGIPPTGVLLSTTLVDERQYFSDSEVPSGGWRRRQNVSVATQTNITATDLRSERCATPPGEWYCHNSSADSDCSASQSDTLRPGDLTIADSNLSDLLVNRVDNANILGSAEEKAQCIQATVEECQFEMELSDDETVQGAPKVPLVSDASMLGRCVSLPSMKPMGGFDDSTDVWASNQYVSTAMNDYTPTASPTYSRPLSPQSDSEVMCFNQDAMSQTHLTGDRLMRLDTVEWKWGEIPETTPHKQPPPAVKRVSSKLSQTPLVLSADLPDCLLEPSATSPEYGPGVACQQSVDIVEEEKSDPVLSGAAALDSAECTVEKLIAETNLALDAGSVQATGTEPGCSTVESQAVEVLEPCPDTKKAAGRRSGQAQGIKGGIYLDELNQDEPELAALYLYSRKTPPPLRTHGMKDDDTESGQGASLPQSPVTVEPESSDAAGLVPAKRSPQNAGASSVTEFALSLCGALDHQDARISEDAFNRYLVTHEALCENPSLVNDPNLVVRVGGKYYNWAIAGPILLSHSVFSRPLTDVCLSRLVAQHLPKKESSYRRGWRFWRRGEAVQTSTAAQPATKDTSTSPPTSQPSSPPDTPQKNKVSPKDLVGADAVLSSDDELETVTVVSTTDQQTDLSLTDAAGLHGKDKCRKSLKLTSEQLASLKLKDGLNDASFSVTTQYQGTTRCHCNIYLWHWDDPIIVSDIDGTITRSDVLGQVLPMLGSMIPMIGSDWSQAGIAQLYQMIHRNGYKFLYLSARAIGQSQLTRDYLRSLKQCNTRLPDGPLLLSPSSLMSAFHKEVIERKPEQFKISCMRDVGALFPPPMNPFCAGFGNKINDVWAYREVGIPMSRIFTVNHKGELRVEMPQAFLSSYGHLSDLVDHLFPPHHKSCIDVATHHAGTSDYTSFTYWRSPVLDVADEIAEFIQSRDVAAVEKNGDTKKSGSAGKRAASPAPTASKVTESSAR